MVDDDRPLPLRADEAGLTMRRFSRGQSNAEVARDLDTSERTIERRWQFARAWLARGLQSAALGGAPERHARFIDTW